MSKLAIRYSGNAILFGFINLPPGESTRYTLELAANIDNWNQEARREQAGGCTTDPDHKFKPCGYIGIGPWNLVTMSLVSEQGLASHLSYLGKVSGQNYFHACDVGLVIPDNLKNRDHLINILNKFKVSYFLERESTISRKTKFKDQYEKKLESIHLHHINSGEIYGVGNLKITQQIIDRLDSKGLSKKVIKQLKTLIGVNATTESDFYSLVDKTLGIEISELYHVKNQILEEAKREPQKELLDIKLLKKVKKTIDKKTVRIPEKEISQYQNSLAQIYQLKFNSLVELQLPETYSETIYLTIIEKLNEGVNKVKSKEQGVCPFFIRPLFSAGFFDCIILMRGYFLPVMEEIISQVRYIKVEDLENTRIKYGLPKIRWKTRWDHQVFHLAYTLTGVPFTKVKATHREMDDWEEKALKKWEKQIKKAKNKKNLPKKPEWKDWLNKDRFDRLSQRFEVYNAPPTTKDTSKYKIIPSTLVSLQTGKMGIVQKKLSEWANFVNESELLCSKLSDTFNIINGRYDFELFQENKSCYFGDYFLAVQLAKRALFRDHHFRAKRKKGRETYVVYENRRLRSPLLEIKSKIGCSYDIGSEENADEKERTKLKHRQLIKPIFFKQLTIELETEFHNSEESNPYFAIELPSGAPIKSICITSLESNENASQSDDAAGRIIDKIRTRLSDAQQTFNNGSHFPITFPHAELKSYLAISFQQCVSKETLESVVSTICSINEMLTEPITFHLFIDLSRYVRHFLGVLFSVVDHFDGKETKLYYWDLNIKRIRGIPIKDSLYVGYEGYMIQIVELLQRVIGQRKQGVHPYHDRNFARLFDLRLMHSKKMVSISWLVNDLCTKAFGSLRKILEKQSNKLQVNWSKDGRSFKIFPDRTPQYLPYFSNNPEMIFHGTERSVSINARSLSNIENIITIAHETGGHAVAAVLDEYPLRKKDGGRSHFSNLAIEGIYLDTLKKTIIDNKLSDFPEVKNNLPLFSSKSKNIESDLSRNDEMLVKQAKDEFFNPDTSIWQEIFSDLFLYKTCFSTLRNFYEEEWGSKNDQRIFKNTRVDSISDRSNVFDIVDDFLLSWILQLVRLPRILRISAFKHLLIRLTVEYGLLKSQFMLEQPRDIFAVKGEDLWDQITNKAVLEKLHQFLHRFIVSKDTAKNSWNLKCAYWKIIYGQLCRVLNKTIAFDMNTELQCFGGDNGKVKEIVDYFVKWQLRPVFLTYFDNYQKELGKGNPFYLYVNYLVENKKSRFAYGKTKAFLNPDNFYFFREGISPPNLNLKSSSDYFASVMQLAGCINLFLAADLSGASLKMPSDYIGFSNHRSQQHLEKSRRIIGSWLWKGALHRIKEQITVS